MFIENIKNEAFRVLIVDDNWDFLQLLVLYFKNPKYKMEIFAAQSALEALELLKEKSFDIVVSDFSMPEMNGLEFFKKIKEKNYKIPFILLSGLDDQAMMINAINAGVDGYIQKGGNISNRFEELVEKIKEKISDYQEREECHNVLKNAPIGIFHAFPNGQLFSANPNMVKTMGFSNFDELIEEFPNIEIAYNDNDNKKELINSLLLSEERWINFDRVCLRKKNNENIFVNLKIRSVRNSKKEIVYLEGFIEDVTELKKSQDKIQCHLKEIEAAKEELEQANYRIELMSGITRHDMGNQLQIILAYLGLVEMEASSPELKNYFEIIETACFSIRNQIKFMKLYKEIGTQKPDWQDLNQKIPRVPKSGIIELVVDIPNGLKIYSDMMIEKVFENLLDNSIRHGEKVSRIKVSAILKDSELMIIWEDNGIGVPEENKEKIFQQGFGKNTGLGLYLIKKNLELTGIKIKEVGEFKKGARFEILVPKNKYRISEDE
jgi:PAS domain S-box-containing protein